MKKLIALVLALAMVATLGLAFAADPSYSITVTNDKDNASIVGKTYKAYKVFDLTLGTKANGSTAYSYSIKNTDWAWSKLTTGATTDDKGVITTTYGIKLTPSATDATVYSVDGQTMTSANARSLADALEAVLPTTADGSAEASGESVTISLEKPGYYAVYGSVKPTDPKAGEEVVAAVALDSTDPTATVKPKVEVPPLDKKITGEHVLDDAGKAATAEVGKVVSFELDSRIPDLTGYSDYTYIFTDTMTNGLTLNQSSMEVKINGSTVDDSGYTYTPSTHGFTLRIPFATLSTYTKGDAVVLTYSATVNDAALTTDYEKNTAKLTYSHSPYDNETNDTPDKKVYVIDVDINVDKVAEASDGTRLKDAKFLVFKGATKPADTDLAWYKWDATNKKVTWVAKADADEFVTGEDGKFTPSVQGLEAEKTGTKYGLLETEAPKGYNLLAEPVIVTLTGALDGNSATITAENATMTNGTINFENEPSAKQPLATAEVINKSGTELPSTGGIGTTIFYILGGLLVIGAAVILVARRKAQD